MANKFVHFRRLFCVTVCFLLLSLEDISLHNIIIANIQNVDAVMQATYKDQQLPLHQMMTTTSSSTQSTFVCYIMWDIEKNQMMEPDRYLYLFYIFNIWIFLFFDVTSKNGKQYIFHQH